MPTPRAILENLESKYEAKEFGGAIQMEVYSVKNFVGPLQKVWAHV